MLDVTYKGKSIGDVLQMSCDEAYDLFDGQTRIRKILQLLKDVGLGYLPLGQSATTLSGGEAQRVKLAAELARPDTGRTLYLLDEPTTGLHFDDVRKLLEVLQRLVDLGNTVLVIEHNLDMIKSADWVIDMGPEAGEDGGRIVAEGPPEKIVATAESRTGQFLKPVLEAGPLVRRDENQVRPSSAVDLAEQDSVFESGAPFGWNEDDDDDDDDDPNAMPPEMQALLAKMEGFLMTYKASKETSKAARDEEKKKKKNRWMDSDF